MSLKMEISNMAVALVESDFFSPDFSPFLLVTREQNPEQSGLNRQFLLVMDIVTFLLHDFHFMPSKIL